MDREAIVIGIMLHTIPSYNDDDDDTIRGCHRTPF